MAKQKFLGGLIAGKIVETAVDKALDRVVKSPAVKVGPVESEAIRQVVVAELRDAQEKHLEFKTNNEPVYKSPVSLGSFGAAISGIGTLVTIFSDGAFTSDEFEIAAFAIVSILGAGFALWGRWFAKKPLGE